MTNGSATSAPAPAYSGTGLHAELLDNLKPGVNDPGFGVPKHEPANPNDCSWDYDVSRRYANVSPAMATKLISSGRLKPCQTERL